MTKMDTKEEIMLRHYKRIIEKRVFDEYDVLGFLIFIRRQLAKGKYYYIRDFADLIAHRERDQGIVYKCILAGKGNNYATNFDGKTLKDYHGIDVDKWNKEWHQLGEEFQLKLCDEVIKEITLCIFSLAQNTQYMQCVEDTNKYKIKTDLGTVKLAFGQDKFLYLITAENSGNAPWVVFAKYGQFDFTRANTEFYLKKPVETIREDGKLRLFDEDGYII